jgi:hypothetical protein
MNKNEEVIEVLERIQEILRGNGCGVFEIVSGELVHTQIPNEQGNEVLSINLELAPTSIVPNIWTLTESKDE